MHAILLIKEYAFYVRVMVILFSFSSLSGSYSVSRSDFFICHIFVVVFTLIGKAEGFQLSWSMS